MATNFVQEGDRITVPAPYAAVRGRFVIVNATSGFGGVAQDNASSGANVVLVVNGVVSFAKPNAVSTAALAGGLAYWDNTNSQVTISATSNVKIGVFPYAVSNTQTTAQVRLNGAW
jgi:predicted RecA/RadA family phage recombinase